MLSSPPREPLQPAAHIAHIAILRTQLEPPTPPYPPPARCSGLSQGTISTSRACSSASSRKATAQSALLTRFNVVWSSSVCAPQPRCESVRPRGASLFRCGSGGMGLIRQRMKRPGGSAHAQQALQPHASLSCDQLRRYGSCFAKPQLRWSPVPAGLPRPRCTHKPSESLAEGQWRAAMPRACRRASLASAVAAVVPAPAITAVLPDAIPRSRSAPLCFSVLIEASAYTHCVLLVRLALVSSMYLLSAFGLRSRSRAPSIVHRLD